MDIRAKRAGRTDNLQAHAKGDVAIRIADQFHTSVDSLFDYQYEGRPKTAVVTFILQGGPPATDKPLPD